MSKNKGDKDMTAITLKEIETRVARNTNRYQDVIRQVTLDIRRQNLKRGRVRPKDPTEAKILARFCKK
ncbi:hypothetical protein [Siminovitchia sp. 179-K 8D1 HS]|uniref:hypothetical protein n=1 Tax=Siminovitchia sp. 179-K 8D1 HS TaxID=3142385 RepID=UPI0039A14B62